MNVVEMEDADAYVRSMVSAKEKTIEFRSKQKLHSITESAQW